MVSTRQSSNVASSGDSYVGQANAPAETTHQAHVGGKLLRSGLSAPPPPPQLPSSSNVSDVIVATPAVPSTSARTLNLLDLPHEILEKIFSFLGYKNVAHLRPVSNEKNIFKPFKRVKWSGF